MAKDLKKKEFVKSTIDLGSVIDSNFDEAVKSFLHYRSQTTISHSDLVIFIPIHR